MTEAPLPPGSTIGILGGGQLGRMLAMAAASLGLRCHIYADVPQSPAFEVAASHALAGFDDTAALTEFARAIDVATIEFENIPVPALEAVAKIVQAYTGAQSMALTHDRLVEKEFLLGLGIAVAPFQPIDTPEQLAPALEKVGLPAMLKTRRLGYDGKGQARLRCAQDIPTAAALLKGPTLLEAFIDFERELSVVVARSRSGEMRRYDPGENVHRDQILFETRVPARISEATANDAIEMAGRIAAGLDIVGVFCVEFFDCGASAPTPLMVNEIAPRVHNSGHWTIDGCQVSQFENHIRAVAGWPLGSTARHSDAVMTNLIGDEVGRWREVANEGATALHLYGKGESRPGRKMGHITRLFPKSSGK